MYSKKIYTSSMYAELQNMHSSVGVQPFPISPTENRTCGRRICGISLSPQINGFLKICM